MGTAEILVLQNNRTFKAITIAQSGDLAQTGRLLFNNYQKSSAVQALLQAGALSRLPAKIMQLPKPDHPRIIQYASLDEVYRRMLEDSNKIWFYYLYNQRQWEYLFLNDRRSLKIVPLETVLQG